MYLKKITKEKLIKFEDEIKKIYETSKQDQNINHETKNG